MADAYQFETEAGHLTSGLSALSYLFGQCQDFPSADDLCSLLAVFERQAGRVERLGMELLFPKG